MSRILKPLIQQRNPAADERAQAIVAAKGVKHVCWVQEGDTWVATATVISSGVLNPTYRCTVYPPERISCECMDFRARGGLCKHLRAALIEVWLSGNV